MKKIKCYVCSGVFSIDEKHRKMAKQGKWFEEQKIIKGIGCPYCHELFCEHLLEQKK